MTEGILRLSLTDWIYRMVLDILNSGAWLIKYRRVYYDKKRKNIVEFVKPVRAGSAARYRRMDACADFERNIIFINPKSVGGEALGLFHECLEILFNDWKDCYFEPKRWGLAEGVDPIGYLEAATWDKLTPRQKNVIKAYLPKRP